MGHYWQAVSELNGSSAPTSWNKTVRRSAFVQSGILKPGSSAQEISAQINNLAHVWQVCTRIDLYTEAGEKYYMLLGELLDHADNGFGSGSTNRVEINPSFWKALKEVVGKCGEDPAEVIEPPATRVRSPNRNYLGETWVEVTLSFLEKV